MMKVEIGDCTLYHADCNNLINEILPRVRAALERAPCAAITPGTRHCFKYPEPYEIGAIFFPAGVGKGRWGFTCSQPILYYGKDPYRGKKGARPQSFESMDKSEQNTGHPCPKPIRVMDWLVQRTTTAVGECVLDPFMGSGTTGISCVRLSRKFIGIERERKYFDIACERIERELAKGKLF